MLIISFVLFLILVIPALRNGDMYAKEALIYGSIFVVCALGFFLLPGYGLWFVAPITIVDVIILIKLVGNPSVT
jgi:hypothetical protein